MNNNVRLNFETVTPVDIVTGISGMVAGAGTVTVMDIDNNLARNSTQSMKHQTSITYLRVNHIDNPKVAAEVSQAPQNALIHGSEAYGIAGAGLLGLISLAGLSVAIRKLMCKGTETHSIQEAGIGPHIFSQMGEKPFIASDNKLDKYFTEDT